MGWTRAVLVIGVGAHTSNYVRVPVASRVLEAAEIDASCESCDSQVHVSLASKDSAVISFVSATASTPSEIRFGRSLERTAKGSRRSYTSLAFVDKLLTAPTMGAPSASDDEVKAMADTTSWATPGSSSYNKVKTTPKGLQSYKNPSAIYSSPVIHTVTLDNLEPGEYSYALPDGEVRSFVFPKSTYPLSFGLTGDLGQTVVSNRSIFELKKADPDVVLIAGDLSYADGWASRWDSFAKLIEPLASRVPTLAAGGNHELGQGENWLHFLERWPTPYVSSQSTSPLYWSVDIGPVHVVALNSYDDFGPRGARLQRDWLVHDLEGVRDDQWIVVMMHVPFYTSNDAHPGEAELMRREFEPLFFAFGVHFVLTGHVHAYERSVQGVYDGNVDVCGPTYLGLGDGGNRQGAAPEWTRAQPEWSAFREASFGVAKLDFASANTARYEWRRHACASSSGAGHLTFDARDCVSPGDDGQKENPQVDAVEFARVDGAVCAARRRELRIHLGFPPAQRSPRPPTSSASSSSHRSFWLTLIIAVAVAAVCAILAAVAHARGILVLPSTGLTPPKACRLTTFQYATSVAALTKASSRLYGYEQIVDQSLATTDKPSVETCIV